VSLSPAFRLTRPTSNGATGTGHTMPAPSWLPPIIHPPPPAPPPPQDALPTQSPHAPPVGAHLHSHHAAVRALHPTTHRLGILGAEEENVTDLDATSGNPLALRHLRLEAGAVVLLVGGRVETGPGGDHGRQVAGEIHIRC